MKEQVRVGVTAGAAADRAFDVAWGTIVKANVASLIGAAVLYWLAVGPVRGFAFYLGAMTLLDMVFLVPLRLSRAPRCWPGRDRASTPARFGMAVDAPPRGRPQQPVTEGVSS